MPEKKFFTLQQDMLEKKYFFIITERRREKSNNKQTPLPPNNEINKPTVGGIPDGKEKTMRYKNYILSKGDKVKLKPYSDDWLPSMTKNYGGKVVTIKDFIYNFGFVCEPLGDDVASYMFDVNDIDEVVYRKNNKDEIKRGLECCAAVGSETSCSDCSYVYRRRDLCKDALDLIIEQEKELEIEKKAVAKEILQRPYDKCYEVQGLRECVAHITPLDILILAKEYGVEVEE